MAAAGLGPILGGGLSTGFLSIWGDVGKVDISTYSRQNTSIIWSVTTALLWYTV